MTETALRCLDCHALIEAPEPYEADLQICSDCLHVGRIRTEEDDEDLDEEFRARRDGFSIVAETRVAPPQRGVNGGWWYCHEFTGVLHYWINGQEVDAATFNYRAAQYDACVGFGK